MNAVQVVRLIGLTHILQPPFTLLLASERGLALRQEVRVLGRLGKAVLENMAVAAVALPTALGLLLAYQAGDVFTAGAARSQALLLAGFWCWRLARQIMVLRPAWPTRGGLARCLERGLTAIFVVQGPALAGLLLWGDRQ